MKEIFKIMLASLVFLVVGSAGGYMVAFNKEHAALIDAFSRVHPVRLNDPSYKFINPLLVYAIPSSEQEAPLSGLKNSISHFVDDQKKYGLTRAAVFTSNLNDGHWIGLNQNDLYAPASMFKVVVMIAYLKGEDQVPGLLNNKLTYNQDIASEVGKDAYNSQTNLKVGVSYAIEDLINKMIIDSDNGAEVLLLKNVDKSVFSDLFAPLNIKDVSPDGNFQISARQYSLFFRILFNATYLNSDLSEKALNLLSRTTFNDALVAGVPEGTLVAHKFGEYVASSDSQITNMQLHDCGIIYAKDDPYFLCVMTEGSDINELKSVIKGISFMVYQFRQTN